MKSIVIAIAILCSLPNQLLASTCPPPPTPLRQLVNHSETIVIGQVRSVQEFTEEFYNGMKVTLDVEQVIQGKLKTETIDVYMDIWSTSYKEQDGLDGSRLMAFINPSEEFQSVYFPTSYQNGYKFLNDSAMKTYQRRIKELQAINALNNEKRREELTVDWLIRCAENPDTRWEGSSELAPFSNYMNVFDEEKNEFIKKIQLSDSQKLRIENIILNSSDLSYIEMELIDAISGWNNTKIYQWIKQNLKTVAPQLLYQKQFLMHRLAIETQRDELIEIISKFAEISFENDEEKWQKEMNEMAYKFVEVL